MTMRTFLVPLLAAAVLGNVGDAYAQVALKLKFTKGQTITYDVQQDMKMTQGIMGQTIDSVVKQTMEFTQTVEEVLPDGSAKLKTKFGRVKMKLSGPVEIEVDSAAAKDGAENPVGKVLFDVVKTLSKLEFTATQRPDGEASDIKVPDEIVKELRDLPGSAKMADLFTEQGIKQLCQNSFTLPKDPVAVGATWNQKMTVKLPFGTMKAEMKMTYQGPETIAGKTLQKIAFIPTSSIGEAPADAGVTLKITSQKGNGVILFDSELGRLQEMTLTQNTEMAIGVGEQNVDQTIVQTTNVKARK